MRPLFWLVCAVTLLPAMASAAKHTVLSPWPDRATRLFAVPTRRNQVGQVVAPVMIDGKGPFRFLVDTGANGSVVSPALVRALGLAPVRMSSEQVEGTTGTERLPWVPIAILRIGDIVKRNLRLPVSDTPVLAGLDGILGMAGFGAVRVVVDFRHNQVIIDRSRPGLLQDSGFLDIHARRTPGGLLMIPARVGDVRVTAVIDTGAEATIGNAALKRALVREAAKEAKEAKEAKIYGVTRKISKGRVAASPTIYLGPVAIRNLAVVYSDIPIFKDWHLDSRPALIVGMNVLGTVDTLALDYPRARIYLLPVSSTSTSVGTCEMYVSSPLMPDGSDCAPGS